jgi:hypothetical protein
MACLEPCNTAPCATTSVPRLPLHYRNSPAFSLGTNPQRPPWSLSFRETRCRSPPGFRARAHPPFPYLWKRTSDCPLLHRGCPTKAPGDSGRTRGTHARNFARGILPGLRSDLDRTARPVATPLPPPNFPRLAYLGVKISPG